jgi:hypothetical protein
MDDLHLFDGECAKSSHQARRLSGFHGIQHCEPHGCGVLTDSDVASFGFSQFDLKQSQCDLPTLWAG